jgi:DNA oxidative demethylase
VGGPTTRCSRIRGRRRASLRLEPQSIYHLTGEARREWEHSIAPMEATRWPITFRSLSAKGRAEGMRG